MQGKTLYLECETGISGDMMVAMLLDLGGDEEGLKKTLAGVPLEGFHVVISQVEKSGIVCKDFDVQLEKPFQNQDHDMEYLYGHSQHEGEHSQGHAGSHAEGYHHSHSAFHRGLKEVEEIIQNTEMTEGAKGIARNIFEILAEAEAKAHGKERDTVHFHEVGAVDSIVDIISVAYLMDQLGIERIWTDALSEGGGSVRCAHGVLPVPVPAVVHILEAYQIPWQRVDRKGELITPTGAAVVAAFYKERKRDERYLIQKTGYGAGKRNYSRPSILRGMLIQPVEQKEPVIYRLETNIDDCAGERLGYVMEKLLEAGARDVHYIPVFMKKNRPAYELVVICTKEDVTRMEDLIFQETTTIGIRKIPVERRVLPREMVTISTVFGDMKAKMVTLSDGTRRIYPEYEEIRQKAMEKNLTYDQVLQVFYKGISEK